MTVAEVKEDVAKQASTDRGAAPVRCLVIGVGGPTRRRLDGLAARSRHNIVLSQESTAAEAAARARDGALDLALVGDSVAVGVASDLARALPGLPMIVLAETPSLAGAVAALRAGAADYLASEALDVETLDRALDNALGQGVQPTGNARSVIAQLSAENRLLRRIALRNLRLLKGQSLPVLAFAWKMVDGGAIADGERPGLVTRLARLTRTITGLIDDTVILVATHRADARAEMVDLGDLVRRIAADPANGLGPGQADLRIGPLPTLCVRRAQMELLFEELLVTAARAGGLGQVPRIEVGSYTDAGGGAAIFVEEDGMVLSARSQAFGRRFADLIEPAADTKRDEHSWSLCQRIVEKNRGAFAISENGAVGSRITLRFPKDMVAA